MLKHLCQQATRLLPDRETSEERRHPIMPDFTISSNGISKLLKNLKPNKVTDPDKIRPLVLRELREETASFHRPPNFQSTTSKFLLPSLCKTMECTAGYSCPGTLAWILQTAGVPDQPLRLKPTEPTSLLTTYIQIYAFPLIAFPAAFYHPALALLTN